MCSDKIFSTNGACSSEYLGTKMPYNSSQLSMSSDLFYLLSRFCYVSFEVTILVLSVLIRTETRSFTKRHCQQLRDHNDVTVFVLPTQGTPSALMSGTWNQIKSLFDQQCPCLWSICGRGKVQHFSYDRVVMTLWLRLFKPSLILNYRNYTKACSFNICRYWMLVISELNIDVFRNWTNSPL